jgi:hypothetical protein
LKDACMIPFPCITAIFHANCAQVVTITAPPCRNTHKEVLLRLNFSNFHCAASEEQGLMGAIIAVAGGSRRQESLLPSTMALADPESRGMSDKTACRSLAGFLRHPPACPLNQGLDPRHPALSRPVGNPDRPTVSTDVRNWGPVLSVARQTEGRLYRHHRSAHLSR